MKLLFGICLATTALFGASRDKDLKAIIEKSYLDTQCAPFLNMMAQKAIGQSQKKLDPEQVIATFRKEIMKDENLQKFYPSLTKLFSDKEIKQLRATLESPVLQKYMHEGVTIAQSHMQLIDSLFHQVASNMEGEACVSLIPQLTKNELEELLASGQPVILDIKAEWCPPCKMMEPILEDLCEQYQGQVAFAKIDFDTQGEIAKEFEVTSLPTLLFIKPNEKNPSMKNIGFLKKEEVAAKIDDFLKTIQN